MKSKNIVLLGALVAMQIATACTDYLHDGKIDLTVPEVELPDVVYTINHPAGLYSQSDFDRVKSKVAAADASDPVYVSWQQFCNNAFTVATYAPNPQETLVRGNVSGTGVTSENYIQACRDAAAALQLAMRWKISGDDACAARAVYILNQWALVCKRITAADNNQYLLAGFQGYQFAQAAELLRDYSGWASADFETFKKWMVDVWYAKNFEFLENHGGTCNLHYWTNWDMANMTSILAIGILLEDQAKINYAIKYFKKGDGSGAIGNMIPYPAVADPAGNSALIAQNMESGRDQGHATLVVSISAEFCQMAYSLGEDLFGYENNRMLAMFEYTAKFNVKPRSLGTFTCTANDMPFTKYEYCVGCSCNSGHSATHTQVADDAGRGTIRPCWDLIYNHYAKVKNLSSNNYYYTALFADQLRYNGATLTGDGGAGDGRYGSNSSAYDQIGWGTMMFTR